MQLPVPQFDRPLTSCPFCALPEIEPFDRDFDGRTVFHCRTCTARFMNPQYTDQYLQAFYSDYCVGEEGTVEPHQAARRKASKIDDLQFIGRHIRPGRFLGIGCGDGLELDIARRLGWKVEGFDVDPAITARVARRLGCRIHSGDFFQLALPDAAYDCIYMDQVLEHPKNPQDYLRAIHRLLRPGGLVMIGVPNTGSLACRAKTALGRLGLKRRRRGRHWDMFQHLFFYSPRALRNILERFFNYEVIAIEGAPLAGIKSKQERGGPLNDSLHALRRRFPVLEGSMRILARKPAVDSVGVASRQAA